YDDYVLSENKKEFLIFEKWDVTDTEAVHIWRDVVTHSEKKRIEYLTSGGKNYFINNKFIIVDAFLKVFDSKINDEILRLFFDEEFSISDDYAFTSYFEENIKDIDASKSIVLNSVIFGNDGFFYLLPRQIKKSKSEYYYILKLDNDFKLVGKRKVKALNNSDYRCVSGIFVDKDGYIYVTSDKDKTIVKFKPIENGENSFVNLSKVK
ncbi:MAG: hypothetical protein MJB14_00035, partial [Spirochaetes bacterium]|nr:hypothetical protein [Spirochaetota bacterium]